VHEQLKKNSHRWDCMKCQIEFGSCIQKWSMAMQIARMINVFVQSEETCFLSFSGADSDGLLTPLGEHDMPSMVVEK